jgi:hypothetical protein
MQDDHLRRADGDGTPAAASAARAVTWSGIAALALLSALCCTPLMAEGWFASHEQIRPIARALAAYYEVAGGDLFPRWLSSGYLGKGVPLFNFYSPAFSLLVAYAHALGVPLLLAAKGLLFALFFAGAAGMYLWVRRHLGHFPGVLAGVLYLYAPYHFVDLYVRGATAEFTSLAALPFLFLAMDLLLERSSARRLAALALASATIVLSHFLGALMIAPFAAVYAVSRARSGGWAGNGRIAAGAAIGAGLSAFYWLPALAERDALSVDRMERTFSGYYSYVHHFVRPAQWFDPAWGFGGSAPEGYDDGMSFQIGLLLLAASAASALLGQRLAGPARRFVLVVLGLGLGALWLTSAWSGPVYAALKPLHLVQFPWRFLGPLTLFFAAGGAGCARVFADRWPSLGPGLAAATAALVVVVSGPQRAVERPIPLPDERVAIEHAVAADDWSARFGNEDEYLPRGASLDAAMTEPGGPFPVGRGVEIGAVRAGRSDVTFEIAARADDGIAVVPWHAFPGWKVTLDGRDWPLAPNPYGLVAFHVPPGRHLARVHFGTTPTRVVAWLLSLAAAVTLGALVVREWAISQRGPPA